MKNTNEIPFVHLYRTVSGYYLYDVNRDRFTQIPKEVYFFLEKQQMGIEEDSAPNSVETYITDLKKKGFLKSRHGIITGVDCYPANQRGSDIILNHLKGQPCEYQEIGLDGGYDIGAVHRGLELLGINGYTAIREYQNNAMKKGFCYDAKKTVLYVCRENI